MYVSKWDSGSIDRLMWNKKPLLPEAEEILAYIYQSLNIDGGRRPRPIWRGTYTAGISKAEGNKKAYPSGLVLFQ